MNKKELSGILARRLCISPVLANNIVRQIFEEIRSQLPLTNLWTTHSCQARC